MKRLKNSWVFVNIQLKNFWISVSKTFDKMPQPAKAFTYHLVMFFSMHLSLLITSKETWEFFISATIAQVGSYLLYLSNHFGAKAAEENQLNYKKP